MNKLIFLVFIFVNTYTKAQIKTDVLVLGATAAGAACAIQAARSGVNVVLIEASQTIVSKNEPTLNIPAFNSGIWQEWKNYTDSSKKTPRNSLEDIIKSVKKLKFYKSVKVIDINPHKHGYTLKIAINGVQQQIKTKILFDARQNINSSDFKEYDVLKPNSQKNNKAKITYHTSLLNNNLYRTSTAAGFGLDSSQIFAVPIGVFITNWNENLLILNQKTAYNTSINPDNFNLALWVSMGQAAGTLAAYSPFFKQPISMVNVRTLQSEILNYKGQLLPIVDVNPQDLAYKAIQHCIISSVLKLNFETGFFYPDSLVDTTNVKPALINLFTRAKVWFLENSNKPLNLQNLISLFSFITTREEIDISREITENWKNKYGFFSPLDYNKILTRKQFAVLVNDYLQPYKVRVNIEGAFLK